MILFRNMREIWGFFGCRGRFAKNRWFGNKLCVPGEFWAQRNASALKKDMHRETESEVGVRFSSVANKVGLTGGDVKFEKDLLTSGRNLILPITQSINGL